MPRIHVGLSDVVAFENLPLGEYLADIEKIELQPTTKEGKFDQLKVTYVVVDGELLGRKQSEWLSLSPKALFRLKKWFAKFGVPDTDDLEVDDETNLLLEPDLVATRVIFKVYNDRPRPGETEPSVRTALVTVEDDDVAPPHVGNIIAAAARGEPVDEKAAQKAALQAQLAALDSDDADEAAAPAAKPAAKKEPKTAAAPVRRQLR